MRNLLAAAFVTCTTFLSSAQNFEADSVYYSPIPKIENREKSENRGNQKFVYFFVVQSGALVGCKDCSFKREVSFSASTIHGIALGRKLRVGAGLGFDTYQNWQVVPIFGSVNWDVFGDKNRNAVFVQFNYGTAKVSHGSANSYYPNVDGGRMVGTLIGYRINYHAVKISVGIGSKYQRVTASYEYPTYYYDLMGTPRMGSPTTSVRTESLNRLSIMMSVGWR